MTVLKEEKVGGRRDLGDRRLHWGFENKISQLGCGISFSQGCLAEARGVGWGAGQAG